jgi:hypothetical protein
MAKIANNYVSKPNAWIVNSTDKGRKSIKNGKVYLQDSEEFQIELFNPLSECVLADIKLNGQPISKTGLVLKPGQRFYLDCFIDDNKKFIFSTYEVEQTLESLTAINNNGKLEVFFYKESVVSVRNWRDRFNTVIIERYYPSYPTYPYWTTTPYYGTGTNIGYSSGIGTTTIGTNNSFNTYGSNVTLTGSATTTGSYTLGSNTTQLNSTSNTSKSLETGRVERGETSKQKFKEIDMEFDNYHISSVVLEMLPESRKPVEVKDVKVKNVKVNIELPKGDWSKKQIEEAKEVVQNFLWKENSDDTQKDMFKNIELIKKLSDLHSAGILTDEEFSEKKKELLSKI